jgi:hypothetical protein
MANTIFPALKYQVQESIFDAKSMLDETNFYHQRQGSPSVLTSKITYILGDYNKAFPLSMMTQGASEGYGSANTVKAIADIQFTYPVMGRDDKVSFCAFSPYAASDVLNSSDYPGIGNGTFYLYFHDNWIKRFYTIQSEGGTQAYVLEDPEPTAQGYRYKVQLSAANPNEFCSYTEFAVGRKWIELFTSVAESESRTTENKMVVPGMFKNQMGIMRTGWSWAGNAANKMMKISVRREGGDATEVWMDYAMWQYEKRWLNDCEHMYWYSRYNRLADGTIPLKDLLTAKTIPTGSGVLEQIANKSTYSKLTYNTLANKVGDALFGVSDSGGMDITLMTGTGGMREFHRAMMDAGATAIGPLGAGDIASKFVSGTGRDLALGGFFSKFYHIDGYTIKVKLNPVFNTGRVAQVGPIHPESGLPLESYRMVFIDDSDVDGQPNIQFVTQEGRSQIDGIVKGLTPMPKSLSIMGGGSSESSKYITTDQDKSSYTRLKTGGIQILRSNRCFDLQCVAGQ